MLASYDDDAIADEELLTGTGSGGLFTSGYLRDRPLIEYLDEEERVAFLLSNKKKGVRRETEDEATVYAPGDGYQAIAAITDTRVLFVVGGSGTDGDEVFSVTYAEMEDVKSDSGMLTKHLDVWSTEGVRWRFYVRATVDIEPATEYLERAAVVWSRAERQLGYARKRFVDANEAIDANDHERAREALDQAETHVEEARNMAAQLTTERDDAIWERVRAARERLDATSLEANCARGRHLTREAERQWRREQYNQAYESYLAARDQYESALEAAPDHAFADVADIEADIEDIADKLDRLAKSPLRRAEQAYERATAVEDPTLAADLLEEALGKYQTALVLDWGAEETRFVGDREDIRSTIARIVNEIEITRRTLAERARERGDEHREASRCGDAREAYAAAIDHLQAVVAVARELRPDSVAALQADIEELRDEIEHVDRRIDESGFEFVGDVESDADD